MDKNQTKAILLINLGTPDNAGVPAVRRFLTQFLNDPRVITPAFIFSVDACQSDHCSVSCTQVLSLISKIMVRGRFSFTVLWFATKREPSKENRRYNKGIPWHALRQSIDGKCFKGHLTKELPEINRCTAISSICLFQYRHSHRKSDE